jgi:hypothetical protein
MVPRILARMSRHLEKKEEEATDERQLPVGQQLPVHILFLLFLLLPFFFFFFFFHSSSWFPFSAYVSAALKPKCAAAVPSEQRCDFLLHLVVGDAPVQVELADGWPLYIFFRKVGQEESTATRQFAPSLAVVVVVLSLHFSFFLFFLFFLF